MNSNQIYHTHFKQNNLLENPQHKQFIELQAAYGFAQRGGSKLPAFSEAHDQRLVSTVNLLDTVEKRRLIFGETIISN